MIESLIIDDFSTKLIHLALCLNTNHSSDSLSILPTLPTTDGRNKEWILNKHNNSFKYRKIIRKTSMTSFYFTYWIKNEISNSLLKCSGCTANSSIDVKKNTRICTKCSSHRNAIVIKVKVLSYAQNNCKYWIITPVNLIKK